MRGGGWRGGRTLEIRGPIVCVFVKLLLLESSLYERILPICVPCQLSFVAQNTLRTHSQEFQLREAVGAGGRKSIRIGHHR